MSAGTPPNLPNRLLNRAGSVCEAPTRVGCDPDDPHDREAAWEPELSTPASCCWSDSLATN